MAMVPSGPMPGSTPISVPTDTPIRQYNRFCSENATLKPKIRLLKRSMASVACDQRVGQAERPHEQDRAERGEEDGEQDHLDRSKFSAGERGADDQRQHRRNEAGAIDQHAKQDERERQDNERAQ